MGIQCYLCSDGRYGFWLSVVRCNRCSYSRRNGMYGSMLFGYSVCVRLFNVDVL